MHFAEMQRIIFCSNFIEICSQGPINSNPALVQIMYQATVWTNDGLVYWRMYALHGFGDLITVHSRMKIFHFTVVQGIRFDGI